jgi:hypothetical protein
MRPGGKGGTFMQNSVRYYIVKTDDQPVVRSVPVSRPRAGTDVSRGVEQARIGAAPRKPSVTSMLRMALRRKKADGLERA